MGAIIDFFKHTFCYCTCHTGVEQANEVENIESEMKIHEKSFCDHKYYSLADDPPTAIKKIV